MRGFATIAAIWLLGAAFGCPRPTPVSGNPSVAGGEDPAAGEEDSPTRIRVTADDAAEHGFPALGVSVDPAGTILLGGTFYEDDNLLGLSGPPGGPLLLRVDAARETPGDVETLRRLVEEAFADPRRGPVTLGAAAEVTAAGAVRTALAVVTGASMARTSWCVIGIPNPGGEPGGLLVYLGIGDGLGDPDCALPLADRHLAAALASLRLER